VEDGTDRPGPRNRADWRALLDARWLVLAVVTTVGAFAFIGSYSHIYDLGRKHAQAGTVARLLPLSVDGLIIAATMVMFIQADRRRAQDWRARWMPRLTLYAAIAATVAANVAYGLPSGWLSAVLSGWPGAAFVAAVELGIIVVRLAPQTGERNENPAAVPAGKAPVPASAFQAATLAYEASAAAHNPLPARQLVARYGITRGQADKIRGRGGVSVAPVPVTAPAGDAPPAPAGASPNGQVAHD
jgi:uncharacterized protein DUF2637